MGTNKAELQEHTNEALSCSLLKINPNNSTNIALSQVVLITGKNIPFCSLGRSKSVKFNELIRSLAIHPSELGEIIANPDGFSSRLCSRNGIFQTKRIIYIYIKESEKERAKVQIFY